jgi:hypothetical protein
VPAAFSRVHSWKRWRRNFHSSREDKKLKQKKNLSLFTPSTWACYANFWAFSLFFTPSKSAAEFVAGKVSRMGLTREGHAAATDITELDSNSI